MTKYTYDFPMSPVATTMVICSYEGNDMLVCLGKRGGDTFNGMWSLPGGYMEAGKEQSVETARREVLEELGIDIPIERWDLFAVDDKPGGDPRYPQVINICYFVVVSEEERKAAVAGDDLEEIRWMPVMDAYDVTMPFRHNEILLWSGYIRERW